jgi:uncharacterized protein YsxB (DUF464 family)
MIKVVYSRNSHRVTIEGHAGSGEKGHDLVCASVSILAYTLASFVQNTGEARQADNIKTDLRDGEALISCEVPIKYQGAVTIVFDAICGGFELLARDYPDYVSYKMEF